MMGKDQIFAAEMNVERLSQVLDRHLGTFDVPSRTALADLGLPESFAWFRRLPQSEVAHLFFFEAVGINARAVLDCSQRLLRKLSVGREFRDAEVIRAILHAISDALLGKLGDK